MYNKMQKLKGQFTLMNWYQRDNEKVLLAIYVQPGAKRSEIAGLHGNELKIKIASPPVEGKANKVLLKFLAQLFEVPIKQVQLKRGEKSRHKTVEIISSLIDPNNIIL